MALTNRRAREIAARVKALARERGSVLPGRLEPPDRARAQEARALRRAGQYEPTTGPGPEGGAETYALGRVVKSGGATRQDADAYLAGKFPEQRFAGGRFGGQGQRVIDAQLASQAARPRGGRALVRAALHSKDLPGTLPNRGTDQPFHVEQRPAQPHTLDGAALKPGSVPASALDLREVGRRLLALPGPEEVIELELEHSLDMDRFVRRASSGVAGPGRIWVAKEPRASQRARLGAGPARYRLIRGAQRFGVMSCRFAPNQSMIQNDRPGFQVSYGIVVARIPHYLGRPPARLISLESVGDSPVALRTQFLDAQSPASWAAAQTFYWTRTHSDHNASTFPFGAAFGADTTLAPTVIDLRNATGFCITPITGRDGGEVFRQLCSRQSLGRIIKPDGHAAGDTIPGPQTIEAATVPSVVHWDEPPTLYTHLTEADDLTAANRRIVQGVPFSYDDCAALVADETHFSVSVQIVVAKLVSQGPTTPWGTPEVWWQNGIKTQDSSSGRLREWLVDIIVD